MAPGRTHLERYSSGNYKGAYAGPIYLVKRACLTFDVRGCYVDHYPPIIGPIKPSLDGLPVEAAFAMKAGIPFKLSAGPITGVRIEACEAAVTVLVKRGR